VQAENYAQAAWAVGARTSGVTEGTFGRLYDDGAFLRTHVLRPTWHFVLPDDIRWLVEVTAPRARRTLEQHQRDVGIDDRALGESEDVIVEALSPGVHRTREDVCDRLRAAGLRDDRSARCSTTPS
jgi:hypothetical protein